MVSTGAQYACFCNLTLVLPLSYTTIGQLSSTASNIMGYSILDGNYLPIFGNILLKSVHSVAKNINIIIYLIVIMLLLKYFELSPGIYLIHALPQFANLISDHIHGKHRRGNLHNQP